MKPFYKSPLQGSKKKKVPQVEKQTQPPEPAEPRLGELTLLEQDTPGCDPYNNTGKLEIKKTPWSNTSK